MDLFKLDITLFTINMDHDSFKAWLDLYGKAWTGRNPELIRDLFAKDAKYFEKPFSAPFDGIDSIIQYWQGVTQTQKNVSFQYNILAVDQDLGIAHFLASFLRYSSTQIKLDGIFLVKLDSQNKCIKFEEWWQSQKN